MMRRALIPAFVILMSLAAGRADALTVRDVIELSKAGLSDSVLLALIDVDHSVFTVDTATLKQLKTDGVSDAVIVAMIHSGRDPQPQSDVPPPPQEPAPEPAAQDTNAPDASASAEAVAAAPPQFVPYPVFVPFYVAVPVAPAGRNAHRAQHAQTAAPVQCFESKIPAWGFGGTVEPQVAAACNK